MEGARARIGRIVGSAAALAVAASAQAQGLERVRTTMESFREQLLTIIPIVAVVALILLAIGYATKFLEKDTFIRWAIGIIIVGSATEITTMLMA